MKNTLLLQFRTLTKNRFIFTKILNGTIFLSFAICELAFAQNTVSSAAQSSGYLSVATNRHWLELQGKPRELVKKSLDDRQQQIANMAERLSANTSVLSLVLIEGDQIIFESYNASSAPQKHMFSWSMSKSLTSLTVGAALCSGKIQSLDKPAEELSSELKGTILGKATVKQLLMMAGGVADAADFTGEHMTSAWTPIAIGQVLTGQEYVQKYGGPVRDLFGERSPGSKFNYSNLNTLALESVVEANGGFLKTFDEQIWKKIGAERKGSWVLDKSGRAVSYAGFSATPRDFARLALWSIDQTANGDDCMGKYLKSASSRQIDNFSNTGRNFKHYGYQMWVNSGPPRPSYWWAGFGGQRVGIDTEKKRVIVVSSWREDYMDQVYSLFERWQID
jgi:CubicO group peptidase (beta-lactamase class C family)